jgi:glycosyltransferase involved in cell wall biosynthesis
MKVLQILPELNAGGVERGTLEIASHLVAMGHQSMVVSHGGRLVDLLESQGSTHISLPVHRKSLATLGQVRRLRHLLASERPDILHIRSRVPGWVAWLAWRGMDPATRPHLVSTVHGFYSVNRYSAVMTKGERVIAVSESIRDYILAKYPACPAGRIRVIHRGVDPQAFPRCHQPDAGWLHQWRRSLALPEGALTILLPGRITRWKGQQDFLRLIAGLKQAGLPAVGLVSGDTHPRKRAFLLELQQLAATLGISSDVHFLGHRSDVREVMAVSDLVVSLSRDPEAFGRVSLEAMSLGRPVAGYDHGGVGEQLRALFPAGRVPVGDEKCLLETCIRLLRDGGTPQAVREPFTLDAMCRRTLEVYQELLTPAIQPCNNPPNDL